jgi:hypothetical protein
MSLPKLAVNRRFMLELIAHEAPCLGLGLVEEEGLQCALIALRPNEVIPREVSASGFRFGHSVLGTRTWEVVQFAFEFYGFQSYNVLINPSNRVARAVLNMMVETGDYFFLALDSDHRATAFRSEIGQDNLSGLKANLSRIRRSTTTEAQYSMAVAQFEKAPDPPGTMLTWVCRDNPDYLDISADRLVLSAA